MSIILADTPSERAVLAGICQYGGRAYFDVANFLKESTFTDSIHSDLFICLQHVLQLDDQSHIDIPLLQSVADGLNLTYLFKTELKYIKAIFQFSITFENIKKLAIKIRKLEIARSLHHKLGTAQDNILKITGNETTSQILNIAEDVVFDFTSSLNSQEDTPKLLGTNLDKYLTDLSDNPIKQIGIPTGYPLYDESIGGGLRKATINIIAGRAKSAKTMFGMNVGHYIASNNIPVLMLDTEMTKEDNIHRITAMINEVAINDIETGNFGQKADIKQKILKSAKTLNSIPYYYKSISGRPFEDQLAIIRRWLMCVVGLDNNGIANDCVIIYDYLKLMDSQGISSNLQEYQLLGFMMTSLHDFAVRYKIPILAFIQLNRDGITKESSDAISGSDRIVWLCSNLSIFKPKSDLEIADGGVRTGNRKLVPVVARHGAGLAYGDYINYHMKGWCAKITEGKTALGSTDDHVEIDEGHIEKNAIPFK